MPVSLLGSDTKPARGDSPTGGAKAPWVKPATVGAVVGSATLAIGVVNPSDSGFEVCWSQRFLGVDCPLCGGLRCVNSLVHGDFLAAADHNLIAAVALPLLTIGWVLWLVSTLRRKPFIVPNVPNWLIGGLAVLVAAFTIARYVGGPAWVDWLASSTYR